MTSQYPGSAPGMHTCAFTIGKQISRAWATLYLDNIGKFDQWGALRGRCLLWHQQPVLTPSRLGLKLDPLGWRDGDSLLSQW